MRRTIISKLANNKTTMFLLGEKDVQKALNLQECLDVNLKALQSISNKSAYVPSRLGLPYPKNPNSVSSSASTQSSTTFAAAEDWTLIKPAGTFCCFFQSARRTFICIGRYSCFVEIKYLHSLPSTLWIGTRRRRYNHYGCGYWNESCKCQSQ